MNLEEKKYDAFISYRHSDLDKFVAESLHKQLEMFKLPKQLVKKNVTAKTKIERVFRDRDELPLASNLADPIMNALNNSEFLIVICTPRLPESMWCQKEVETFIQMHGREKVFAVLAEGEPEQSFPPQLLHEDQEVRLPDGTVEKKRVAIEPLAADVRGASKKEILKKIKEETLRLTAPMFGVSYDDLKQRHRERRMKRIMTFSLSAAAVFLVFGAVSSIMALQIKKQSNEIEAQSLQIEQQYEESMENYAKTLGDTSLRLLDEGDRMGALYVARAALPSDFANQDIPYTARAQYALTSGLYTYEREDSIVVKRILKSEAKITATDVSPKGSKVATRDNYGDITIWNPYTGEKTAVLSEDSGDSYGANDIAFLDEDRLIYCSYKGTFVYDINEQKPVFSAENVSGDIYVSDDQRAFAIIDYQKLSVYDANSYQLKYSYEGHLDSGSFDFSYDGDLVTFAERNDEDNSISVKLFSTATKAEYFTHTYEGGYIDRIMLNEDNNMLLLSHNSYEDESDLLSPYRGQVDAYDLDGNFMWTYEHSAGGISGIYNCLMNKENTVAYTSYCEIGVLDIHTGKFIYNCALESNVASIINDYVIITNEGKFMTYSDSTVWDYSSEFVCPQGTVSNASYGDGFCMIQMLNSNCVYISEYPEMTGKEDVYLGEDYIGELVSNDAGTRTILSSSSSEEYKVINESGEELYAIPKTYGGGIVTMVEDGSKEFAVIDRDAAIIYDINSGTVLRTYEFVSLSEEYVSEVGKVNSEKNACYLRMGTGICTISLLDGSIINQIPINISSIYGIPITMAPQFDRAAYVSVEDNKLYFVDEQGQEAYAPMDVNAKYISDIFWNANEKYIFILYENDNIDIYDVTTGQYIASCQGDHYSTELSTICDGQFYMVSVVGEAYILNDQFEAIADIKGCCGYQKDTNHFLCTQDTKFYVYPFFTLDELLERANEVLGDYEISDRQKEEFYLD